MDPRTARMLAENEEKAAKAPPPPQGLARTTRDVTAWVRAHRLLATVSAAATLVVIFAGYVTLVARPAQRREQAARELRAVEHLKVETAVAQTALNQCLSTAKAEADARWNAACKKRGQRGGCALSTRLADEYQQQEGQARNLCLMRFSLTGQ